MGRGEREMGERETHRQGDSPIFAETKIGTVPARQCPGQIAAELLAVAQHLIGFDPTRRRGEPDGDEQANDLLDRPRSESVDHGWSSAIARTIEAIAEHSLAMVLLPLPEGPTSGRLPRRRMMSDGG